MFVICLQYFYNMICSLLLLFRAPDPWDLKRTLNSCNTSVMHQPLAWSRDDVRNGAWSERNSAITYFVKASNYFIWYHLIFLHTGQNNNSNCWISAMATCKEKKGYFKLLHVYDLISKLEAYIRPQCLQVAHRIKVQEDRVNRVIRLDTLPASQLHNRIWQRLHLNRGTFSCISFYGFTGLMTLRATTALRLYVYLLQLPSILFVSGHLTIIGSASWDL